MNHAYMMITNGGLFSADWRVTSRFLCTACHQQQSAPSPLIALGPHQRQAHQRALLAHLVEVLNKVMPAAAHECAILLTWQTHIVLVTARRKR